MIQGTILYALVFFALYSGIFYLLTFFEAKDKKELKNDHAPSVTFIVPIFNKQDSMTRTVNSILESDYPGDKIRLIIVNDGSTDDSLIKARELAEQHKNISIINKKNEGKAVAINCAIKQAETELIATLDADSTIQPDLLKKSVAYFADPDIKAVTCRQKPINTNNFLCKIQELEYTMVGFFRKMMSFIKSLAVAPNFTIYRSEVFSEYGLFDVGNLTEDYEMGMRIQSHHGSIAYVVDSFAKTEVPSNFKDLRKQRVRWGYGALYNINKYRHLFSPKYGDYGTFIMPVTLLGILALITALLFVGHSILDYSLGFLHHLSLGWVPSLSNIDMFYLTLFATEPKVIIFFLSMSVLITIFVLTRKMTKDKISFLNYIIYIIAYNWLVGYFYVIAISRFILNKPPKW